MDEVLGRIVVPAAGVVEVVPGADGGFAGVGEGGGARVVAGEVVVHLLGARVEVFEQRAVSGAVPQLVQ